MSAPSNIHFYINWAKERLDEMEATLTSLEAKDRRRAQSDVRGMADKVSDRAAQEARRIPRHRHEERRGQRGGLDRRQGKTGGRLEGFRG